MTQANRPSYGEMRDKLTPDDVEGKAAALTIASVELRDMAPRGARNAENKIILTFREFPGKEYIANATSYKTLVSKLGDNYNEWAGRTCIMAPTTNTFDGRSYEKLHVASVDRWDKVVAQLEKPAATTRKGK